MTDPLFCDLVATQQLGERAPIRSRVGSKAMILKSETYHFHRLDLTTMKTGSGWQRRRRSELPSKPSSKRERSSTTRLRARENSSPDRGKRQAMADFKYAMGGDHGLSNDKEDPRSSHRQGMWSNLHRPSLIKFSSRAVLAIRSPLVR